MSEGNVWFVGIGLPFEGRDATGAEAIDVMSFIKGRVLTDHDNGCFDVELPIVLHNVMESDGWFQVAFDLGDLYFEIMAEQSS